VVGPGENLKRNGREDDTTGAGIHRPQLTFIAMIYSDTTEGERVGKFGKGTKEGHQAGKRGTKESREAFMSGLTGQSKKLGGGGK